MSGKRHKDYETVKRLITGNQLNDFMEIFTIIPKSVINKDLGINYKRFNDLLIKVQGFKLEELYTLSHFIGVDEKVIVDLAHNHYLSKKPKLARKKPGIEQKRS